MFSSLPSLPKIELPSAPPPIVGTSTELYERIGRGLRRCWLGLDSPMRQTHLYEAIAEPAHKGGRAEIIIREKDAVEGAAAGSGQRGGRALRIAIQPDVSSADRATVEIENLKLPEADAARLKRDVNAWAIGGLGCEAAAEADAWTPSAPPAADANHKPPKKSKAARKPDRPAKTGG